MCADNQTIEYDKEITERPTHLNAAFFYEVLEIAVRSAKVVVKGIRFTMGSTTGDNYCSRIYRVRIEYCTNNDEQLRCLTVIVKSIPHLETVEFLEDLQVYLKEKIVYYEVLPRLEILLGNRRRFGPKLYHSLKQPENTLVFEDLGCGGYGMASREKGLDERHCRLVMQRLAEFHAASIALVKKDPKIFATFDGGLLSKEALERDDGMLIRYFTGNAQQLHALISSWPGYERTTAKIKKYMDNLRENLINSQAPIENEFKVLNHGDLWVNNMLFKYADDNDDNLQDVIFLDFQMSIWSSPGIDLNYFFYTSMSLDVLQQKRIGLIKEYHQTLCATLRALGLSAETPSYEQILAEVRRREAYGFFASYGIFPTVSQDKSETADNNLENFADEEFAKRKIAQMFASKRLAETLPFTLKHFEDAGIL